MKSILPETLTNIDTQLSEVLARFPTLVLALVFGSLNLSRAVQ